VSTGRPASEDLEILFDAALIVSDGTVAAANGAARELFGLHADPAGGSASTLLPDGLQRLLVDAAQGRAVDGALVLTRPDGAVLSASCRATRVAGGDGAQPRVLVVARVTGASAAADHLDRFVDENPWPVLRISREGILLYANPGSWMLLNHWGCGRGEPVPAEWAQRARQVLDGRLSYEYEVVIRGQTLSLMAVPVPGMGYVNLYGLDVTRHRRAEAKIHLDAKVFESSTQGIMITDAEQRILDVNRAFATITGYALEDVLGRTPAILHSGRHDALFYSQMWATVEAEGSWQGEIWDRRKNGEIYPKLLSLSSVTDPQGKVTHYVGLFSDITSLKQTEESLHYMAHFDALTGLPNRRLFQDRLAQALKEARRSGGNLGLLFLDLDGFKLVNDHLGHRAGDRMLREVASRLRAALRETDTVARMGGDEFTVIVPALRESRHAAAVARSLMEALADPLVLDGQEVFVRPSVGIALYPGDASDAESLVRNADAAMYRAKELGGNGFQFYSRALNDSASERLTLYGALRRALDNRAIIAYYQPQVELGSGRFTGAEALARWVDEKGGIINPDRFIPLAEETGLIGEIGERMLRQACAQVRVWNASGAHDLKVAVNMSARQLGQQDLPALVEQVLAETGCQPQWLELELTESTLVSNLEDTVSKLERLKELGITIAIDDFGTGYSSLAYLGRLPIDRLKIDRSFVKELPDGQRDAGITTAIIAIARSLRLQVTAEGVEGQEQLAYLRDAGCDQAQGYYCGRPLAADAVLPLLLAGYCQGHRAGEEAT
jgi:diguanylate cyclase (GGDEF)-like protein/PAS domain S-box-containing protein